MRNLLFITMFMAIANVTGCIATNSRKTIYEFGGTDLHEIDMSKFTIKEFKDQTACDSTFQCKFILYGKGLCNSHKGYLIYSTAIGKKNEKHLFDEVKSNREKEIEDQKNNNTGDICLPMFRAEPLLFCGESDRGSVCLDAADVMLDQSREIRMLREKLDLNDKNN